MDKKLVQALSKGQHIWVTKLIFNDHDFLEMDLT